MEFLTPLFVIIGFGAVIYLLKFQKSATDFDQQYGQLIEENVTLKAHLDERTREIGKLSEQNEMERMERNQQEGKGKALFAQNKQIEAALENTAKENQELRSRLTRFEAERERKEKEHADSITKIAHAEQSFRREQERVIQEDMEYRKQLEEARDRMWADHENTVIAALTDLCKQPQFAFTAYNNTNLPAGFDGSLKPDFMIEFLGQYVIFDAKVSKAKSLQTYINNQVKDTVQKVKDNEQIYKSIFLIVPTSAISELKNHHYIVEGYSVFVISPEAVVPILASLKRIALYEFAEQMDPQQRENVVQLIAELDFHINLRNAADIIMSKMGTELLQKTQRVDPALAEEVALKKQPMNAKASLAAADIKRMVSKLSNQEEEIEQLVSPQVAVQPRDIDQMKSALIDTVMEKTTLKALNRKKNNEMDAVQTLL